MSLVAWTATGAAAGGLGWYTRAEVAVRALASATGRAPDDVAAALAICSPRVHVVQSVRLARHWLDTGEPHPGTLPNTCAALAWYQASGEIRGPKTGAFARALLGDLDAVVIDVWILRALAVPEDHSPRGAAYDRLAARVRRLARRVGHSPRDTQAALWVGYQLHVGRTPADLAIPLDAGPDRP